MSELPVIDERPDRCETCRFWDGYEHMTREEMIDRSASKFESGSCRRYPPVPYVDCEPTRLENLTYGTPADRFPLTTHDDWCGEWQAALQSELTKVTLPHNPKLDLLIDEIGLSGRALNCLEAEMDHRQATMPNGQLGPAPLTVGDLASLTPADLLCLRNFGHGTLEHVRLRLALHGLTLLGDSLPE